MPTGGIAARLTAMPTAVAGNKIEYTRSGERSIAYTTIGQGGVDLVWLPAMASNLDVLLEEPCRGFVDALAARGARRY